MSTIPPHKQLAELCNKRNIHKIINLLKKYPEINLNTKDNDGNAPIVNFLISDYSKWIEIEDFLNIQTETVIKIDTWVIDPFFLGADSRHLIDIAFECHPQCAKKLILYALKTDQIINFNININCDVKISISTIFEAFILFGDIILLEKILKQTISTPYPIDLKYNRNQSIGGCSNLKIYMTTPFNPHFSLSVKDNIRQFLFVIGISNIEQVEENTNQHEWINFFGKYNQMVSLKLIILRTFIYRTIGYRSPLKIPNNYPPLLYQWPTYERELEIAKNNQKYCHCSN